MVSDHAPAILIVDDDPQLRQTLVQALQKTGAVCIEADSGVQALAQLAKHDDIGLVMSDVRMPLMDGIELLTRVRAHWPDIAMMMITGVDNTRIAVHCLSVGAVDYLIKPFQLDEVRARVALALQKRRLMIEHRIYQEALKENAALQARRVERFLVSLPSLADVLEAKDPYSRGHSARVSHYASIIASDRSTLGRMLILPSGPVIRSRPTHASRRRWSTAKSSSTASTTWPCAKRWPKRRRIV